MKVLIADSLDPRGIERLQQIGCTVIAAPGLGADDLPAALEEHRASVLIVRSTRVEASAIDAAKKLQLIVRAGAGFDTIDVAAASRAGVFVANCPGKNAIAVAELTWGLILACDRRVAEQAAELRAGTWNKKRYSEGRGLFGRTLGVLGAGDIAREVILRARGFGMHVVCWSRNLTDERARELGVERSASPVAVARRADVLTVHVASTADTRHLVSRDVIDALADGAYVINTSRGAVVDEAALLDGIARKGLRAGLDVYDGEPKSGSGRFESALAASDAVTGTHHIGASTDQAQLAIAMEAVRVVERFVDSGQVQNCVNLADRSSATWLLTVRHKNRPGVLAHVFQVLSEAGINVEEMENVLYQTAIAACARVRLSGQPTDEHLARIQQRCEHILSMELTPLAQGA